MLIPPIDWTPIVTIRERIERRNNRDFNRAVDDDRTVLGTRLSAGASFKGKGFSGQLLYNFNQDNIYSRPRDFTETRSDLQLGYVKFSHQSGDWTVGRQFIKKGNERLIGDAPWPAVSVSWDGVRFQKAGWDAWATRLGAANRASRQTNMAGVAYASKAGETMYFYRHGESVDAHTLDHLYSNTVGKRTISVEAAVQAGKRQGKDLEAWATAVRYSYRTNAKLTLAVEGAAASGGSNKDKSFTFENALASNHPIYGLMDMQSWKNSQVLSFYATYRPTSAWTVDLGYHRFGLRDAADAWYGANGAQNGGFLDPTGRSGREVGQEFDLQVAYNPTAKLGFLAGASVFQPGRFIRSIRGQNATEQTWLFAQVSYKF